MGLDQWLYKARKATKEEIATLKREGTTNNLIVLNLNDENEDDIETIRDIMTVIELPVDHTNWERLLKAYNLDTDYELISLHSGGGMSTPISIGLRKPGSDEVIHIDLMPEECKSYQDTTMEKHGVFWAKELTYWRKNWPLQEYLNVANVSYTKLSREQVEEIVDRGLHKNYEDDETEIPLISSLYSYVYHPWW